MKWLVKETVIYEKEIEAETKEQALEYYAQLSANSYTKSITAKKLNSSDVKCQTHTTQGNNGCI